jgi:3-carboxy-cis,cis-muconate cycloisomerase
VAVLLAGRLGRQAAHEVVGQAARRSAEGGTFRDALLADERVALSEAELDAALDPTTYLGSAETLVDRALERYAHEEAA